MTESEFDPAERDSALIRLVDDEPDVRAALSLMLEIEGWRCVSYASAREFLVENMDSPGCLVLDVRMPGMSGLELQQAMEERGIELPVIFLTGHGDLDTAIQSLKAGAKALSDRERHLLELISLGRSDARIASELGISKRTVQGHRAKIYRKFGIHSGKVLEAMLPDIMRLIGR